MSDFFQVGTFSVAGCPPFAGIVKDKRVVAIHALTGFRGESTLDLLQNWTQNFPLLRAAVADPGFAALPALSLEHVHVYAPILYPRQIFCAGANYRQHVIDLIIDQNKSPEAENMTVEERRAWGAQMMDKRAKHGIPYVFTKIPSTISGPYDEVIIPKDAEQPDWELELVVVIGKAARRVSREHAMDYVAGYTIANDLTNREKVHRADMKAIGSDWLAGKCSPGYLPMGPFITPAAFIPDPHHLHLTLKLNGETMQDQQADDMIFDIPRLIEYTSHLAQLWPGDILLTGSPKGNGTHYNRYLQPGDVMEGTITGLGTQRTPCVAEA
ncbi:MAG TPA: fumarylacetoacetate hydrolase family protein [Anaerolineales bacterium]|nr:fumarylacetoacetate hydrolase family protein [Anaerolineales bacterium]